MKRPAAALPESKRQCTGPTGLSKDMFEEVGLTSLDEAFDRLAATFAERPAVEDDSQSWTYQELQEASLRIAAGMTAKLEPGDPPVVAVLLRRTCTWVATCLASARVGVLLALSCDLGTDEEVARNRESIEEHHPRLLVLERDMVAPSLEVPLVYAEDLLLTQAPFESRKSRHLDDALYLVYTGGTTAASKCVVQTHRMALHELKAYPDFNVMSEEDRVLHHTSAYWGATCLGLLDLPWSCGACLVLVAQHGVSEVARAINERQITVAGLVPSLLDALDVKNCKSLRTVFTWGEPLRQATIDTWRSRVQLVDLLIASEYWLVLFADHREGDHQGFRPVRGARLTLLQTEDAAGAVAQGEVGELYIAGPMVSAKGYCKTSLNEGAFVELPVGPGGSLVRHYRTRDLARFRADGALEYCGRADGFAKVGGKWLDLAAVERSLQAAGCREASLLWDEVAKVRHACVVLEEMVKPLAAAASRLQALLPPQTRLHLLKQLPKNAATGKVARAVLLQQLRMQDGVSSESSRHGPVSRSLALGVRLASGLVQNGTLVPVTFCLAPALLKLLWMGFDEETPGHVQNGASKDNGTCNSERTVPLGVAERVGSWLSWYRSITGYLSLKELELLPYVCLLLLDGSATGLEGFARVVQNPMGILGGALFLCRRAPKWAKILWYLAGRRHGAKRGGDGWSWVFWLAFPGYADTWSNNCWHAWPHGQCGDGAWQALDGIVKALKAKEFSELMRCTHCWDWVQESSGTTWHRKSYCAACTEGWEVYKKRRCDELGVDSVSPDPTPDGTPWSTPLGTPTATPRANTQVPDKEKKESKPAVVTVDFADYEVSLATRQSQCRAGPRKAPKAAVSKVAEILERSTGVSDDELSGLESLKVIILVSALRKELGVNLAAGDVLQCSSVTELEAVVEAAATAPRSQEGEVQGKPSSAGYPIYAIPRFWKAPVGWLISLDEIPDETAMRIACRALVRRHVGLRAVPYRTPGDEASATLCMSAITTLLVLRALLGIKVGSKPPLDDTVAQGLLNAWPRVASAPPSGGWPMCEAGGAEELAHFEWLRFETEADMRHAAWLKARSRGFRTPASISVLCMPSANGKESAFLQIAVNHAVTDAAAIVPLVTDLLELHRVAKTLPSSDLEAAASAALEQCQLPEAPDGMAIAEARLRSAVLWTKEGWEEQLDLGHNSCPPRKRGYDYYVKLAPSAGRVLEAAAGATGIPTDHLLVAALAISLSVAAKLEEVKLTLIVPMRDGPGHGQAVANLASTRHLSIWTRSRSLFDVALELSSRFRRRDWHTCNLLDDDGDRLFINLRSIPAFDGAAPVIEPQDTTRRTTRFVRNIVEMFADQETLHSWTLWMGLREDVDANAFSGALRKALWGLATKPLDPLE